MLSNQVGPPLCPQAEGSTRFGDGLKRPIIAETRLSSGGVRSARALDTPDPMPSFPLEPITGDIPKDIFYRAPNPALRTGLVQQSVQIAASRDLTLVVGRHLFHYFTFHGDKRCTSLSVPDHKPRCPIVVASKVPTAMT